MTWSRAGLRSRGLDATNEVPAQRSQKQGSAAHIMPRPPSPKSPAQRPICSPPCGLDTDYTKSTLLTKALNDGRCGRISLMSCGSNGDSASMVAFSDSNVASDSAWQPQAHGNVVARSGVPHAMDSGSTLGGASSSPLQPEVDDLPRQQQASRTNTARATGEPVATEEAMLLPGCIMETGSGNAFFPVCSTH